jgi:hypothetical protein
MIIIVINQENFQTNLSIHYNNNTRNKHNFHRPNANLSSFSKKEHSALATEFSMVCHLVLTHEEAKFTAGFKKILKYALLLLYR